MLAVLATQELERKVDKFGGISESADATVSIEVGTEPHMVDAHHLDGMLQVCDGIHDVGLSLLAQESMIERGMSHTSTSRKGAHLVIGQVAGHIAERPAAAVAAHDGSLTDFQSIIETLLASMAQVHHDAQAVHLPDHLLAEAAHAIVGVATAGTVADVVVAIVAEGDVHDATLGEMLHVGQVVFQGQSVLYAEHDTLPALSLVTVKVGGGTCDAEILIVLAHDFLYLVEDKVGILGRALHVERHLAAEALAYLGLRQVGHHRGGILMAVGHLVQVHKNARVAMVELHALREEHRCVAMGVEGKYAPVQLLGRIEVVGLVHEPAEYLAALLAKPLRMPLHTQYLLILAALDGLDDAIRRLGDNTHMPARLAHRLMVERIDQYLLRPIYII